MPPSAFRRWGRLTEAITAAVSAALRWQAGATTGLWVRGESGSLDPSEASAPLLPSGRRDAWTLEVGAALEDFLAVRVGSGRDEVLGEPLQFMKSGLAP